MTWGYILAIAPINKKYCYDQLMPSEIIGSTKLLVIAKTCTNIMAGIIIMIQNLNISSESILGDICRVQETCRKQ